MGIKVEFDPELALRNPSECKRGARKKEECLPDPIVKGKTYDFLKREQRNYWFLGEVPLIETKGNGVISRPRASIQMIEATHFFDGKEVWTKGKYKVLEVFTDNEIKFEMTDRVGKRYN